MKTIIFDMFKDKNFETLDSYAAPKSMEGVIDIMASKLHEGKDYVILKGLNKSQTNWLERQGFHIDPQMSGSGKLIHSVGWW